MFGLLMTYDPCIFIYPSFHPSLIIIVSVCRSAFYIFINHSSFSYIPSSLTETSGLKPIYAQWPMWSFLCIIPRLSFLFSSKQTKTKKWGQAVGNVSNYGAILLVASLFKIHEYNCSHIPTFVSCNDKRSVALEWLNTFITDLAPANQQKISF